MAVFLLPTRAGWAVVSVFVAVSLIVPWAHGWTVDGTMAFQIFVSALAAWGVSQVIQRNAQLVEARNEITRLALAEQRNQFSRDMHDILGHSLTVVAVKAELAGRLTSLDPERAGIEIADVERIARQALADVRAAAAGYREVTLAGELASARTALAAAGIEADLPDHDISGDPAAPAGAVRLGGPRRRHQRGAAQRRHPLPDPGHPQRGRDQRRRLRAARPGRRQRLHGRWRVRRLARDSAWTTAAWRGAVPPAGTAWPGCGNGPPARGQGHRRPPAGGGFALRVRMP